ncbi:hypothetical protein D3C84_1054050 [compost metagenome]
MVRLLVGSVALVPVQLWAQPSPPLVSPQVLPAQVRLWPWAAPLTLPAQDRHSRPLSNPPKRTWVVVVAAA